MTSRAAPALLQALALMQAPRGPRPGPADRLPDGMEILIRIVAGDEQAIALAQAGSGETVDSVREAAGFYIQQVMFAANSDSYRVLGLDADASEMRLKAHYRWLTRWLHPDRNRDEWEAVYAERVNRAWQDLRSGDRRQRYDERMAASSGAAANLATEKVVRQPPTVFLGGEDASWNLRWLPRAVFGALGLSAILVVTLFYALRFADSPSADARPPAELAPEFRRSTAPATEVEVAAGDPRQPWVAAQQATAVGAAAPPSVAVETVAEPDPVPAAVLPSPTKRIAASTPEPIRELGLPPPPEKRRAVATTPTSIRPEPSPAERVGARVDTVSAPTTAPSVATAESPPRATAAAATTPESPTTPRLHIDNRDANRVLGRFSELYSQGNLVQMRDMFTADARGPRGGLGAILADYDRLFETSSQRSLAVRDVSWFANGATLTIIASYQATVMTSGSRRPRKFQGDLRLDLRREDEQWRIYRLQHDERPG